MKYRYLILIVFYALTSNFAQNIMVNQVGYIINREKIVYFTSTADSFYVTGNSNDAVLFSGKVEVSKLNDAASGANIYFGDFSSFNTSGTFKIKTNTGDSSYSFDISLNPFNDVYNKSLKGFYFQRCGTPLLESNAGKYIHPACHLNDGLFHTTTGLNGSKDVTGGWHDAGDYGKYIVNSGITVGTMLMGYEQFPENFRNDDLNIPESGNSIPDLLDEVKYELNWMLKMQDSDGGVFFKVTPENFSGFIMPNTDNSTRYIYQKSTAATGDFAAVMAMAARIYLPFDSAFASKCLSSAENAWQYLQANPSIVPAGGFHNPSGTVTGEYGDNNDSDERLWAAVELFNTTDNSTYQSYYLSNYQSAGMIYYAMSWGNVTSLAQMEYLLSQQSDADAAAKNNIKTSLINYCNQLYNTAGNDGFNVTLKTTDYNWGSNAVVLNNAVLLIIGYKLTGNMNFYNTALEQLNYILGTNINDYSYITDVGSKYPMHPHHRPSASDGIVEPVPGLMAGGPNHDLQDNVLNTLYNSSTPPARCYVDDQGSYASNEIAINWNAPLVFAAGYFSGTKNISDLKSKTGSIPNNFRLGQNYPNPFNPQTIIPYKMKNSGNVRFTIYNILGCRIFSKTIHGNRGNNSFVFNGAGLNSGIYFYQMKTDNYTASKKMIILK